ncbi:MAG: 4-carboxymuconolactone decarboxylase domain/alkylhydroperoxidase AhpD family core domain protein [uncultured Craurococcus sp.]|uniref:4-carboxymuconolactone decarboxylase domain/alkylhydroperoxidase AhpD family core domain protein n=1 Tax=uncultured Craurococcus sp. TaxID=1135998 RepID=A0A6J4H468_9PROT|nr:MAG: 4-carboxymuconolactone decarboxylase domain/alkylhydroperoxidase AhpD family core domain protein [uncultured Craurococcus sp.]
MSQRLNPPQANPGLYKALLALETQIRNSGLPHGLMDLVKTRASQINNCAYCIHMHSRDALKAGETPERLLLLSAWRESSLYTAQERAALAWTEALTLLPQAGAPDPDYAAAAEQFSPAELVSLTTLIGMINLWNRLGVGFRLEHPAR